MVFFVSLTQNKKEEYDMHAITTFLGGVPFAVFLLIVGFVFLIKGADFFVEGSSAVAKKLRIPSMIIGLTIVAMGTSLPETAVSVSASMHGNNAMAVSNVVGSNIFNLIVVIGMCAIFTPVAVARDSLRVDIPMSLGAAILLLALSAGVNSLTLGRAEGCILAICFIVYIGFMIRSAMKARLMGAPQQEQQEPAAIMPGWKCILYIVVGVAGIALGGDWVVKSASTIASAFGISQNIIGLTIVAVGTSLPELVTSIVAARKKDVDMALGNALGSNIYNILMVLGVASLLSPISLSMLDIFDIACLIGVTILVWIMAWTRRKLDRKEGIIMVATYVLYMVYICLR